MTITSEQVIEKRASGGYEAEHEGTWGKDDKRQDAQFQEGGLQECKPKTMDSQKLQAEQVEGETSISPDLIGRKSSGREDIKEARRQRAIKGRESVKAWNAQRLHVIWKAQHSTEQKSVKLGSTQAGDGRQCAGAQGAVEGEASGGQEEVKGQQEALAWWEQGAQEAVKGHAEQHEALAWWDRPAEKYQSVTKSVIRWSDNDALAGANGKDWRSKAKRGDSRQRHSKDRRSDRQTSISDWPWENQQPELDAILGLWSWTTLEELAEV